MNKLLKKYFFIMVTLLALLLAACGGSAETGGDESTPNQEGAENGETATEETSGDLRISMILKTLSSPYWKYVEAGAKQAAEDFGVEVVVVGPPSEAEVMQQVNMIDDQLSQNPDAIVLAPIQPETVVPSLSDVDIPVLTIDTDADIPDKITFIGSDNYSAGRAGGELIVENLEPGDKVAIIRGALGNTAMDDRSKGATDVFNEAGVEIVAEQPADSDKAKAMSVMENILQSNPDVKAVFCGNDDMAIGALRAIQEKGLDIIVVGVDGTEEAIQSIIDGGLFGSIAQKPYAMGYLGVENAIKAIKGEPIKSRIDSGIDVITAENAKDHLEFLQSLTK